MIGLLSRKEHSDEGLPPKTQQTMVVLDRLELPEWDERLYLRKHNQTVPSYGPFTVRASRWRD
ncbi:MAG: hypothetical protein HQL54_13240 [Magnetococcales bacterium]|nr:hypothetical protein [Magnetococcales bacterium]